MNLTNGKQIAVASSANEVVGQMRYHRTSKEIESQISH